MLVTSTFSNRGATAIDVDLVDAIRADHSFESSPEGPTDLFWAYDKHFGQAYGVVAEGHDILGANARRLMLRYRDRDGKVAVRLAPGETYRLTRRVIPGANLFDVRRVAERSGRQGGSARPARREGHGGAARPARPTSCSRATASRMAWGRTDDEGRLLLGAGEAPGVLTVSALGHGSKTVTLAPRGPRGRSRSSCPRPRWS